MSITDGIWELVELLGEPASRGAGERPVHLAFDSEQGRVHGFAGCNMFSGSYELQPVAEGERFRLGPLAVTRRACRDGMDLESQVLWVLEHATGAMTGAGRLEMHSDGDELLARFEARSPAVERP